MKFVADCMLGKLAKWLKILGFDTAYFSKIEDDDLLIFAQNESRILLTRVDRKIQKCSGPVYTQRKMVRANSGSLEGVPPLWESKPEFPMYRMQHSSKDPSKRAC